MFLLKSSHTKSPAIPRWPLILIVLAISFNAASQEQASPHGHATSLPSSIFASSPTRPAQRDSMPVEIGFPVTNSSESAQHFFNQGMDLLHADWAREAERYFRTALLHDSRCMMAKWGVAVSHLMRQPDNALPWIIELEEASPAGLTSIEKALIRALPDYELLKGKDTLRWKRAFVRDLRSTITELPGEVAPRGILTSLLSNRWYPDLALLDESPETVLKEIQAIRKLDPDHPALRQGLHLWSNGLLHDPYKTTTEYFDPNSLTPSPVAGEQWSILSRYLSERERYPEALKAGSIAMGIQDAWIRRNQFTPELVHGYPEVMGTTPRLFRKLGNAEASMGIAHHLLQLPRHPGLNAPETPFSSAQLGRQLLLEDCYYFGLWEELEDALEDGRLPMLRTAESQAEHVFAKGLTCWFLGRTNGFHSAHRRLNDLASLIVGSSLEHETNEFNPEAPEESEHDHSRMRQWLEDGGRLQLTVRDWNRSLKALAAHQSGDSAQAAGLLSACHWIPHLLRSRLLWSVGAHREARQALLNTPELPMSLRTQAIEASRKRLDLFPLQAALTEKSLAEARSAESLTDMKLPVWQPFPLPSFRVPLLRGGELTNGDLLGRNTLLIWIYSSLCSHCAEQLTAIRSAEARLNDAGLQVVVISGQPKKELSQWLATRIPFPIRFACDTKEDSFKTIHAYDHFEKLPLHATLFVDASGKIRWQDKGDSPFMDIPFLIEETIRLRNQATPIQKESQSAQHEPETDSLRLH